MRARAACLVLSCTFMLAIAPSSAHGYCRAGVDTKNGICVETDQPRLFWPRSCLTYTFDNQMFERLPEFTEPQVRQLVQGAFDMWLTPDCTSAGFSVQAADNVSQEVPIDFEFGKKSHSVVSVLTPAEWSRYLVEDADQPEQSAEGNRTPVGEVDRTTFALTMLWHDPKSGEIYDVDLAFNLGAGEFTNCDRGCVGRQLDLQNTMAHEAGHVLGLGHSREPDATMFYMALPGSTHMRTLEQDDYEGLCALDLAPHQCATASDCSCPPAPIYSARRRVVGGCTLSNSTVSSGRPQHGAGVALLALVCVLGISRIRSRPAAAS